MQSPQNPYEQPAAPPVSASTPVPAGQAGQVSLDLISQAWALVSPNIGTWVGATVVYFLISGAFNFIQQRLTAGSDSSALLGLLSILVSLISIALGQFLIGGLMRMAITQARSGRADFGQLFSAGDVLLNLVIAGVITGIITAIGFVLCIVPGLIALALFSVVTPLIVDRRVGALEALSQSVNVTKPHIGPLLLLMLVLFVINILGIIPCGLGLLVTLPLSFVTIALVYQSLFGGEMTAPTNFNPPPSAPIANPNL